MRYTLRKQEKIASVFGDDYLKNHIIKSLDKYFSKQKDEEIINSIERMLMPMRLVKLVIRFYASTTLPMITQCWSLQLLVCNMMY